MEEWCSIRERGWKTNEEKTVCRLSLDEHPSFPFSTNLIKINHLLPSPRFTTESNSVPFLDYSSACRNVPRLFVVIFWRLRSSTWGWLLFQYFQRAAAFSQLWPWPRWYLRSCWEKSLRTCPTLNFQGEKILRQWFNLMLFCSVSQRVIFHLNHSVIMWHTHPHTDSLIISCLLQSCFSHMFTL